MTPSRQPSPIQRARLMLPVRIKLATVSAALTFVILCLFAVVIGWFASARVRANFDDDLRATAADLQQSISVAQLSQEKQADLIRRLREAAAGGAAIRIVDRYGGVIASTRGAVDLGPPVDGVLDVPGYRVASRPVLSAPERQAETGPFGFLPEPVARVAAWVQYAKPTGSVDRTVNRVWLFLALGVLGGTALAFLAGLLVARRAMRPISGLTRAAREVARTRDPDITLPKPEARDEVSELAHTLEDMLGELSAARSESEATLERQREFVADASHELRTPLTSILANLELLESELEGDQREIAGSALRSSRRMRRLVADLLLLARADAGREAPRRTVDLAQMAREATGEAAPLAADAQLALDAPASVPVEGVPDDLHRLALNLIENALLHTPQGTPVTVAVRREGEEGVLEVSDRGPGIPESLRERVFERFSRGAGAGDVTPTRSGSGLGLAIVRAVAEAHDGSVELTQAPGGGARFVVRLPLGAAALAPAATPERLAEEEIES